MEFIKLLFLLLTCNVYTIVSASYDEVTALTTKELAAIPQFKKLILPLIPPTSYVNKWVNDDLYLVNWLRAKNGKINDAVDLFKNHMKWREAENIDNVDTEDWSDVEGDFPIFTDGVDKIGQPVSELWFSDWQTRKAVLSGKLKRAVKWIGNSFEISNRRLYAARAEGKKVSQAIMLVDLQAFSVINQACPSCLPVYVGTTQLLEQHYPGLYESMNLCNMPSSFNLILSMVKPVMRASTRKTLKVYVTENQWKPILEQKIDASQRSVRFGGSKIRSQKS